ncbi:hypothetical protein, partial [Lactobacillus mulieris]|uniref:hypothetical protein n=1 Tax=Lactobacillus mulieris TaxID=2508708 RepID=UPI00254C8EB6
ALEIIMILKSFKNAGIIELIDAIARPKIAVFFCPICFTTKPLIKTNIVTNIETMVVISSMLTKD